MKLENNVPITPIKHPNCRHKFDFALKMEVGQSFVAPTRSDRVSALSFLIRQYNGRKYVSRVQKDGTFRIWRTA